MNNDALRPFPRSVESLAQLALRETRADGFAIYQLDPDSGDPMLKICGGLQTAESGKVKGIGVASFPLRIENGVAGCLSFVFRNPNIKPSDQPLLEKIARAIESIWKASRAAERYAQTAQRIGEMEAELADAKIADRASGILQTAAASRASVDAIARHVESVLRPSELETTLARLEHELAEQLAERDLTAQAKKVLQSRYGITEEQAHVHLRMVSRTSRRRLRDIAQALIENPVLYAPEGELQAKGF